MKKLLVLSMVLSSFVSYSQIVEKQTTYVIKMSEQEYNNYVNGSKQTTKTHYKNKKSNGSFGVVGGGSIQFNSKSISTFSWGGWIDFGQFGVEYNSSIEVGDMTNILSTTISQNNTITHSEIISSNYSKNYGGFYKTRGGLYYGGGLQVNHKIGLKTISSVSSIKGVISYPSYSEINENTPIPYVTIGYLRNLGEWFTFKGGLLVSKTTMINVGVGYSF